MKQDWRVYAKRADFAEIGKRYGIDQVTARIMRNRDIITEEEHEEYLHAGLDSLHSPHLMKDMDKAAQCVMRAIDGRMPVRIIGDYDIDGISSIYILCRGLRRLGADVDFVVPHRVYDGYGINERLIKEAYDDGRNVLITCDNGIAAYSQIKYAKELGMTVVVTDHHDVPYDEADGVRRYIIPPADAVVNPKQEDCSYPWKKLCGATVAMKLIQALYELYGRPDDEIYDFLEFAAIATVGDVVDLQGENRTIVRHGLKKIKNSANLGLNALIDVNKLSRNRITAFHIGFIIGPCLNASGRLETARMAVDLLMTNDKETAETSAGKLLALNEERKKMTLKGTDDAISMIDGGTLKDDKVLVVYLPQCHESIVGIIAGRLRERYNKPVIVFADGEGCLKGSGRSIEKYNMFEKISECKDLLMKFGGHPMAAGMSISSDNLDVFRKELNEKCGLTEEDLVCRVWIDVAMPFDYITEKLVDELSLLEPFGKGNEKPVFAEQNLRILRLTHMGLEGQYTKMMLEKENGFVMEAVMFSINEELERAYAEKRKVSVLYYPSVNEYNGSRRLQVVVGGVQG